MPSNQDRLADALAYAASVHAGQARKGRGTPYISHPLAVASLVLEAGGDEDEAIAALLHDAAEDQGGAARIADIRARFGDRVGEIVAGCSDSLAEDASRKAPWRERKEAHIEHLRSAPRSVALVAAADMVHNARSVLADLRLVGDAVWTRFKGGRDGTLWYQAAALDALRWDDQAPRPLVDELERTLAEIRALLDEPRAPIPPEATGLD